MNLALALSLAIELARSGRDALNTETPRPGDLVFQTSGMGASDPDGIGWLERHGEAAYNENGTGPTREVWDVIPLNPDASPMSEYEGVRYQRWENASFAKVPDHIVRRLGLEMTAGKDSA